MGRRCWPTSLKSAPVSSDVQGVSAPASLAPQDEGLLATVLPFVPPVRAAETGDQDRIGQALDLLRRRGGDHAASLPATLGRPLVRIERLLAEGPSSIDPSHIDPTAAITTAERIIASAGRVIDLVTQESAVLGDALAADLHTLSFDELHEVAAAVLELSAAPRAVPSWAIPAAARSADIVLQVSADDLRAAARSHEQLYDRFTEGIWLVSGPLLEAATRRWRVIARARLRRELREVSRSGRAPIPLTAAATEVLAARAAREQVASLAPLLTHHLADLDHGPFSDVDAAMTALGAVQRLQGTLGDLLDEERLHGLLAADAFRTEDVAGPAANLRNAVRAWVHDVAAAGGDDAGRLDVAELARWATDTAELLPLLVEGAEAAALLDVPAPTLRSLVETLLIREHVRELVTEMHPSGDRARRGSEA
jgi:hypothetical protein